MTVSPAARNRRDTIIDAESLRDTFREDVLEGLAREQKAISPKHLYDARGSDLFEAICELDEYYPTRTEAAIFDRVLAEIADAIGPGAVLIEPGAGSGEKAERLLEAMHDPAAFVPVEISRSFVEAAADRIAEGFEDVVVAPVCEDFTRGLIVPDDLPDGPRVVFVPGSTLGNFDPKARHGLLEDFAEAAGKGGLVLLGTDLKKDPAILRAAYNDADGVTAAFNLNLLTRINRELGASFDPDLFVHDAPWVEERSRVEMRLVATRAHEVRVDDQTFAFDEGEWIHTESSNKFTPDEFDALATRAGLTLEDAWTDERTWFRVALYRSN